MTGIQYDVTDIGMRPLLYTGLFCILFTTLILNIYNHHNAYSMVRIVIFFTNLLKLFVFFKCFSDIFH